MAVKINGNNPLGPMNQIKKSTGDPGVKNSGKKQASDRVDFSTVFSEVTSAKEAGQVFGVERNEKVQELKEQISAGTYKPDLMKVAASLLKFVIGGR